MIEHHRRNTMNRITAAFAAAVLAAVSLLVVATPAQAAVCNSGTFCLYNHSDATGLMYARRISELLRSRCVTLPSNVTNRTEYIRNRSADNIIVYRGASCSDTPAVIFAGTADRMTGVWVNTISSYYRS